MSVATARRTDTAPVPAAPSMPLRAATFATAVAGLCTMVAAGIVAAPAGAATAVLVAAATLVSVRFGSPRARENRRRVAVVALGLTALTAFAANGGGVSDATATVLGLLLCGAAVTHALVLDTVRDQRVNIVVSLSMLLLAAGLAPGLSIAVPVVLTWCCAVVALVLASGEAQGARADVRASVVATERTTPTPARPWGAVASCAAVAVLIGVAVALVLPHPPEVSARSSFGTGDERSRTPVGSANRSASAYLGEGRLNLDSRGRLDDTPIALVQGGGELWRANVMTTYDGHGWYPRSNDAVPPLATTAVPSDPLSPPQPDAASRRDVVGWFGETQPTVISPGLVTEVQVRDGSSVLPEVDGRLTLPFSTTPTYAVTADVVPRVGGIEGPEVGADADARVWRALPATVPPRVAILARQITAGTTSRADAVRAVQSYLRQNATYDLDSPVAPLRADVVDDFLFNTRTGFCEHFASAEVVLLRSIDIPSRLVTGFSAGPAGQDGTVLRASDAHAWVEVWIEGTGWVSSDPTAGAALASGSGGGLTGALQKVVDLATGSTRGKVVVAALLLLAAVTALLVPARRRRRREEADARRAAPSAPLFAAFRRFEEALEAAGAPRAPSESVRTLSERWSQAEPTGDRAVVRALLTVERASYAGVPPTREEARDAAETIDRAAARLLTRAED